MNSLNHTLRRFNRFELKYLITLKQATQFKSALSNFLVPDEHGNNNGTYELVSLYYDSPDLRCYWEKLDGLKIRRKLRIRLYDNHEIITEETPVFVEIKQRVDRITQKRRIVLPYRDALLLCNDRQIPDHDDCDHATTQEIYTFAWQYNLQPTSIVRYTRQAFMSDDYDIGLRVTFDTNLTGQRNHLNIHESPNDLTILDPNWVVMEIKVNERIPYWLSELVASHNFQLMRMSKYCRSIDLVPDIMMNEDQVSVFNSSEEVLSSAFAVFNPSQLQAQPRK